MRLNARFRRVQKRLKRRWIFVANGIGNGGSASASAQVAVLPCESGAAVSEGYEMDDVRFSAKLRIPGWKFRDARRRGSERIERRNRI